MAGGCSKTVSDIQKTARLIKLIALFTDIRPLLNRGRHTSLKSHMLVATVYLNKGFSTPSAYLYTYKLCSLKM